MRSAVVKLVSGWLAIAVLGAQALGAAAPRPPLAPPPPAPRPPIVRPPRTVSGQLPEGPETPADKLPAQYFATIGETEIQYRQWAKAEAAFSQACQRETDPARRAPYAYRLGQLHMRKKEYDKALPLIEQAVANIKGAARSYDSRRYRMTLASLYEKVGKPEKVEAVYQDWLATATNRYEKDLARRQLLSFWKRTGKLDEVIKRYETLAAAKPPDSDALATLRLIYTSVKPDPAKALEVTEKLAAANPDDRDTALYLVSAYERTRQYDKAIPLLEQLIAKNPRDASFLATRLVELYVQSDQRDKAVAYARTMLEKQPKNADTHSRVAAIFQRLKLIDDALAEYEAAAGLAATQSQRDRYMLSAAHAARRAKKYAKAEQLAKTLAASTSKLTAAQAKRLLFDLYEEQNKLDQLELAPRKKGDK